MRPINSLTFLVCAVITSLWTSGTAAHSLPLSQPHSVSRNSRSRNHSMPFPRSSRFLAHLTQPSSSPHSPHSRHPSVLLSRRRADEVCWSWRPSRRQERPHLLFFYGTGSDHCQAMEPLIKQVENEYGVKIVRLDVWGDRVSMKLLQAVDEGGRCSGLPYFYNARTTEYICGATHINNIRLWAADRQCDFLIPSNAKERKSLRITKTLNKETFLSAFADHLPTITPNQHPAQTYTKLTTALLTSSNVAAYTRKTAPPQVPWLNIHVIRAFRQLNKLWKAHGILRTQHSKDAL
eukprot:GHVN01029554.1.p1 GENE.GHVN01029554.1~~GHVN01029554.1.p1  ORF type:complete len:342 (-),score=74.96 GHVN01029554.1:234-1109(-)